MRGSKSVPGIVLALLAVALLAGCSNGSTSRGHPITAHATAPVQVVAAAKLSWQQVSLPAGITLGTSVDLAISPDQDGLAWVCAPQGASKFAFWQTTDTGATWHQTGTLTLPPTPYPVGGCRLVPDTGSDHTLMAVFMYGTGEGGTLGGITFISTDDGATWRGLAAMGLAPVFATAGNTTFAVFVQGDQQTTSAQPRLAASSDGFHTLRTITLPGALSSTAIYALWGAPGTASLVVGASGTAWETEDDGAHWTSIPIPASQVHNDFQVHFVVRASPAAPWMICGAGEPTPQTTPATSSSDQINLGLQCSTNLGQTWHIVPTWTATSNCTACYKNGGSYSNTQPCTVSMAMPDGSLLAFCAPPGTSTGTSTLGGAWSIFRLPANASIWQDFGMPPGTAGSIIAATRTQVWFVTENGDSATGIWVATLPSPPA